MNRLLLPILLLPTLLWPSAGHAQANKAQVNKSRPKAKTQAQSQPKAKAKAQPKDVPFYISGYKEPWGLQGVFKGTYRAEKGKMLVFVQHARIRATPPHPKSKVPLDQLTSYRILSISAGVTEKPKKGRLASDGLPLRYDSLYLSTPHSGYNKLLQPGQEFQLSNLRFSIDRAADNDLSQSYLSFYTGATPEFKGKKAGETSTYPYMLGIGKTPLAR